MGAFIKDHKNKSRRIAVYMNYAKPIGF